MSQVSKSQAGNKYFKTGDVVTSATKIGGQGCTGDLRSGATYALV